MTKQDCCNRPTTEQEWKRSFRDGRYCGRCRQCLTHKGCGCHTCPACNKKQPPKEMCPRCHYCKSHHLERVFKAGEFPFRPCTYEFNERNTPKPTFNLNPLQRSLGVEIELEQFQGLAQTDCRHIRFNIEHDGSVAGSGRELVTHKLQGDAFLTGMSDLARAIKERRCVAGPTAGLHVHVDAVDYNTLDLKRAFVLFAIIQNQLFGTLVARDRLENQFCPPIRGTKDELTNLIRLSKPSDINKFFYKYLYNIQPVDGMVLTPAQVKATMNRVMRDVQACKAKKYMNTARRQALNFHSWMMRGTLEFRLHEGTVEPEDLLMWPLWCGWFVQKVTGISDKEVEYWLTKKKPSIVELSERFAEGKIAMPKSVLDWVKKKSASGASNSPEVPATPMDRVVDNMPTRARWIDAVVPPTWAERAQAAQAANEAAARVQAAQADPNVRYYQTIQAYQQAATQQVQAERARTIMVGNQTYRLSPITGEYVAVGNQ